MKFKFDWVELIEKPILDILLDIDNKLIEKFLSNEKNKMKIATTIK